MSIVVFWLEPGGQASHHEFAADDLLPALRFSEERRREGKRHVCISTALPQSVGQGGVNAVEGGRLPDGHVYDFNKSHRGRGRAPAIVDGASASEHNPPRSGVCRPDGRGAEMVNHRTRELDPAHTGVRRA